MVLGTSAGWTGHLAKAVHQAKVDHQGQGSHLTRLHIWKWSEMHNGIFSDLYLTSPSSSETKLILRFFLRPELENIQLRMFSWAAVENVQNVWWECSAETVETAWGECSSELQPVALNLISAFFRACSCNVHLGPGLCSLRVVQKAIFGSFVFFKRDQPSTVCTEAFFEYFAGRILIANNQQWLIYSQKSNRLGTML